MTYSNFLSMMMWLSISIGMYLMGANHTGKGLWNRSSAKPLWIRARFELGRLHRRLLAAFGKPVQVLPAHVLKRRGRAVTIRDRVYIFPNDR